MPQSIPGANLPAFSNQVISRCCFGCILLFFSFLLLFVVVVLGLFVCLFVLLLLFVFGFEVAVILPVFS